MGIPDSIEIATTAQVDEATIVKIKATISHCHLNQVSQLSVSRAMTANSVLHVQCFCCAY